MKVMLDTNIIISAILFPNGRASEALKKALAPPFQPVVCDYIADELNRKFNEKFPHKIAEYERFVNLFLSIVTVVSTPEIIVGDELLIRDVKDRPII